MKKNLSRHQIDSGMAIIMCVALLKLIINILFHGQYGYFRDELYYIACSDHLAWGYVDHPPFSILILAITRFIAGDSLYAIRFPAALAGACTVVLTGLMVRKLGGGKYAQFLATLAMALSPVVLGNGARYFSMNAFDLLFWAWAMYIVITIIQDDKPKLWLVFGVVAGLGTMNKYSMLFLCFGLVAGLILTSQRSQLKSKWLWLGVLIASIIVLPHIIWEIRNGLPSLEFMHRASSEKNVHMGLPEFLISQTMQIFYAQGLLCIVGIIYFFVSRDVGKFRLFGWMYFIVLAVMVAGNAKSYYLTPIYAVYTAAGALWLEKAIRRFNMNWLKPAAAVVLILFDLVVIPFTIPVLPVDKFVQYMHMLGVTLKAEEHSSLGELPQYYADMFGWEEFTATIAQVYQELTPEEQAHCVIFTRNYGEAAAVDFFGKKYNLPHSLCGHNNYWLWGTDMTDMKAAIIIGNSSSEEENMADLQSPGRFQEARLAARTSCDYCMPYENNRQVYLCRGPHFSFKQIWDKEKFFI
jgi:hypothetical protein